MSRQVLFPKGGRRVKILFPFYFRIINIKNMGVPLLARAALKAGRPPTQGRSPSGLVPWPRCRPPYGLAAGSSAIRYGGPCGPPNARQKNSIQSSIYSCANRNSPHTNSVFFSLLCQLLPTVVFPLCSLVGAAAAMYGLELLCQGGYPGGGSGGPAANGYNSLPSILAAGPERGGNIPHINTFPNPGSIIYFQIS